MNYLQTLNANQSLAAHWDGGPFLVLAGPGSGKTATLTARVARLVEGSPSESFRILCLTFTRKAATEMRGRVQKLVGAARTRVLLTTFHSFSTDILRQHGSYFGLKPDFEIIEEKERIGLVKSIFSKNSNLFSGLISAEKSVSTLDLLFQNAIEDNQVSNFLKNTPIVEQIKILFFMYKELLQKENCLDYGSILYFCENLLRVRPRLAKQLQTVYRYICVDEFQDTNIIQYRILRALAPDRQANLFIVADDDQIIYQWNGASPTRIKELAEHYDLQTIQLPENYRCPPMVVDLANRLIANNPDRVAGKHPLIPMKLEINKNAVRLKFFDDQNAEANWISEDIKERLESNRLPHDIVILSRNTKLLENIKRVLESKNIFVYLQKRKSQFESAPMQFVINSLKLATVRADDDFVPMISKALSDCIGEEFDPEEIIRFSGKSNGDHLEAFGEWTASTSDKLPKNLRDSIAELVCGAYANFIENTFSYFDFVENQSQNGVERFVDYPSERQVWNSIIDELGGKREAYSMPLSQFLQELALANKTPEAPLNAVRCLTIHASKGMEFNHVYLIGMVEDQLPSFQSKKAGDNSREIQEERRNCFVAITRSIDSLTLTYANHYGGWQKEPSRFLYEMELLVEKPE